MVQIKYHCIHSGLVIFLVVFVFYSLHGFPPFAMAGIKLLYGMHNPGNNLSVSFEELMKGPYVLTDDHPQLIQHVQRILTPPKSLSEPKKIKKDTSMGQSMEIINILGEKRNKGFYVECGAHDGGFQSNTVLLENQYGWNGLLIEANPKLYEQLLLKKRNAWTINVCVSLNPYPNRVIFQTDGVWGKITNKKLTSETNAKYNPVQCIPFYSILLALNTTTIDFFSLDVEGFELDVLKTIPWNKVNIRTLSVEFINIKVGKNTLGQYAEKNAANVRAGKKALRIYMESVGYIIYNVVGLKYGGLKSDYIFYRNDVMPKKPSN